MRDKKPLYLAGFLGGATEQVVNAIEGKEMKDNFCHPTPLQNVYKEPPVEERDAATRDDRVIDRTAVWKVFAEGGHKNLALINGLTLEENREHFHTPVVDRAIELVLIGLSRIRPNLDRTD